MSFDLRPLSLGELLDRSFSLYRRHFWLFVGLMAIPSAITLLIGVTMQLLPAFAPPGFTDGSQIDPERMANLGAFIAIFVATTAVLVLAYWIAYLVALGATTAAVSEIYVGRTATIASSYAHLRSHVGRLMLLFVFIGLRLLGILLALIAIVLLASFVIALAIRPLGALMGGLGTIGAFLAASLYSLRYAVSVPALVLENVTAGTAIRRSVALTRGSLGRVFVLIFFATVITYAAMALFQGPFAVGAMMAGPESRSGFWLNLAGVVTGTLAGAITGPVMIIALALLYYDVRIRREGLDLDMMIASLDPHGPSPPSSTAASAG